MADGSGGGGDGAGGGGGGGGGEDWRASMSKEHRSKVCSHIMAKLARFYPSIPGNVRRVSLSG